MTSKRNPSTYSLRTVEAKLLDALKVAIDEGLGRTKNPSLFSTNQPARARILLGFSGGRDSVALIKALAVLKNKRNSPIEAVQALHVHHALSPNANRWARFCRKTAADLGIDFKVIHVMVKTKGEGVEAAARKARYQALYKAADAFGATMVMTAHHEDDRLETFLIQWMRGAGLEGLATFPLVRQEGNVALVRPWLHVPRVLIERYLELYQLSWVEDESNADTTYLRNAVRHEVLPVMDKMRPGFRSAAARSVELVAQASELLRDYAKEDLKRIEGPSRSLDIAKLMRLSSARQALVLRAWIESFGILPPSRAKLTEALRQTRETMSDTKLTLKLTHFEIKRHGGQLVMRESQPQIKDKTQFESIQFKGEGCYPVKSWTGELIVRKATETEVGVPLSVLLDNSWQVRPRQGGEKLKVHRQRPRKHLKALYSEANIAEFDRPKLPLLWHGDDLIFAAGLGMDVRYLSQATTDEPVFVISWKPDDTLLTLMQG